MQSVKRSGKLIGGEKWMNLAVAHWTHLWKYGKDRQRKRKREREIQDSGSGDRYTPACPSQDAFPTDRNLVDQLKALYDKVLGNFYSEIVKCLESFRGDDDDRDREGDGDGEGDHMAWKTDLEHMCS